MEQVEEKKVLKTCNRCNNTKALSEFSKANTCVDGHRNYCKICHKAKKDEWRNRNKEHHNQKGKDWVAANKEKRKLISRKYYDSLQIEVRRERKKNTISKNPNHYRAYVSNRRARVKQATPKWANIFFLKEAYSLAIERSRVTGFAWHVDHIIPLNGKSVCGLHVEYNVRVIPASENIRKSNKIVDM